MHRQRCRAHLVALLLLLPGQHLLGGLDLDLLHITARQRQQAAGMALLQQEARASTARHTQQAAAALPPATGGACNACNEHAGR